MMVLRRKWPPKSFGYPRFHGTLQASPEYSDIHIYSQELCGMLSSAKARQLQQIQIQQENQYSFTLLDDEISLLSTLLEVWKRVTNSCKPAFTINILMITSKESLCHPSKVCRVRNREWHAVADFEVFAYFTSDHSPAHSCPPLPS